MKECFGYQFQVSLSKEVSKLRQHRACPAACQPAITTLSGMHANYSQNLQTGSAVMHYLDQGTTTCTHKHTHQMCSYKQSMFNHTGNQQQSIKKPSKLQTKSMLAC